MARLGTQSSLSLEMGAYAFFFTLLSDELQAQLGKFCFSS